MEFVRDCLLFPKKELLLLGDLIKINYGFPRRSDSDVLPCWLNGQMNVCCVSCGSRNILSGITLDKQSLALESFKRFKCPTTANFISHLCLYKLTMMAAISIRGFGSDSLKHRRTYLRPIIMPNKVKCMHLRQQLLCI